MVKVSPVLGVKPLTSETSSVAPFSEIVPLALDHGLVITARAAGARAGAADLFIEGRTGFEGQARDRHRTGIAGRKSAAAIDGHCTCRAGPADRAAVVDSDRRIAVRTVNDESAVFDCGVAAVRIAAGKRYGSGTVNNNVASRRAVADGAAKRGRNSRSRVKRQRVAVEHHRGRVSGVARQRRERIVVEKLEAGCLPIDRAADAAERQRRLNRRW